MRFVKLLLQGLVTIVWATYALLVVGERVNRATANATGFRGTIGGLSSVAKHPPVDALLVPKAAFVGTLLALEVVFAPLDRARSGPSADGQSR